MNCNMPFTKLTIKNFKCFKAEQSVAFARPDSGLVGSGITYIVGANNSGKTTIIESLSIKKDSKIKSSNRTEGNDPEFKLFDENGLRRKCSLIRPESYTIEENPSISGSDLFQIISSRRHWDSGAQQKHNSLGQSFGSSQAFENRNNAIAVGSELKFIESDSVKYAEFINLVQKVIPEFTKFAVGYEDHEFIEYISGANVRHKTELLGDGVITVIRILLHLYTADNNPLIIDEPELSLHPAAQKKLLKLIGEFSKNRQIILSTHSPYFINWEYLRNGATLNRVVKNEDKDSSVFSIRDFTKYDSLIKSANWQQPFLLDEVAKEILFMDDNILFLEGQEDVGLLRKESLNEDINIFGYGVRGKDNFRFALELVKDLGYKKVCCILDNGASENLIKSLLESQYKDIGYEIIQWNKNDIRDKASYSTTEKTGYFTRDGNKKPSSDLDDFEGKIADVNRYFKGVK